MAIFSVRPLSHFKIQGGLSPTRRIPSAAIKSANCEVCAALNKEQPGNGKVKKLRVLYIPTRAKKRTGYP